MKMKTLLAILAIGSIAIFAGCKKDDYVETKGICPIVISTVPTNGTTGVPINQVITVTFNERMNPATITQTSFTLQGSSKVSGTLTYDGSGPTFSFAPSIPLLYNTTYTGRVATSVKDNAGNALQKEYVWTFTTIAQYTVVLSANPLAGGTTTGGGTFDNGSSVTIGATANSGYTFTNWTEGVNVVSSNANYTFIISGNRTLVANFTENINVYTVTLSSNPPAGGTTTGGGSYNSGASVTVGATANSGYTFTNWTEGVNVVSTNANYLFTVTGNRTLVANFTVNINAYMVTLSSNPPAGGTTTGGGSYNSGASVTVGATANAGYTFTNWTEGINVVSYDANYLFTLSGNRTLVANFTENINVYTISLSSNPLLGGTTTGGGSFNAGTSITVGATSNAGYTFTNWTEGTNVVSTNANYLFTVSGNRTLVANFTENINVYTISLSSNPLLGGTTTGGGSFIAGISITVGATANAGYTFTNWTEGTNLVSSNANYIFTVSGNRTLVANFTENINVYTISLSSNPLLGGITTGGGSFNAGTSITVGATANAGYTFTNWTEGTNVVSTIANYLFTVSGNRTLVANFTENVSVYTVAVTANPLIGGTVTGGGSYNAGSPVTVGATANAGYTFTNWTEGEAVVSTDANYLFTVSGNRTLVANFTENVSVYTVEVAANPLIGGTVTGGGSYNAGSPVTVGATANAGYTFTNWTEGSLIVSTDANYNFTITGNRTLTANFNKGAVGPGAVNLGSAADFEILTKSGISTTGVTSITGDIGVSPAAASAITGFGLIMDANNESSHTPIVIGKVYAADYAAPTPAKMTTAVSDMETAYTTANGLTVPAPVVELGAGDISGMNLAPGLYKWSTGLLISGSGVTLTGSADDTWVFQIAQNLTVENSVIITLAGGAQAKNIFWVVAGQATLGTMVNFSGNILSKTLISLNDGAIITGRLLAQTAVTLIGSTVIKP